MHIKINVYNQPTLNNGYQIGSMLGSVVVNDKDVSLEISYNNTNYINRYEYWVVLNKDLNFGFHRFQVPKEHYEEISSFLTQSNEEEIALAQASQPAQVPPISPPPVKARSSNPILDLKLK